MDKKVKSIYGVVPMRKFEITLANGLDKEQVVAQFCSVKDNGVLIFGVDDPRMKLDDTAKGTMLLVGVYPNGSWNRLKEVE